jgi:hypothetical protein
MKEKLPSPAFVLSAAAADCCTPALLHLRCRNLSESFEAACHFAFVPLYRYQVGIKICILLDPKIDPKRLVIDHHIRKFYVYITLRQLQ